MTFEEIQAVYLVMKELNGTPLSGDFGFVIYSGLAEIGTVTSEELHNRDDGIQGKFRRAPLNKTLLDYAINTVKPDGMLISHCDFDDSLTTGFPTAGRSWGADRDCSTLYGGV